MFLYIIEFLLRNKDFDVKSGMKLEENSTLYCILKALAFIQQFPSTTEQNQCSESNLRGFFQFKNILTVSNTSQYKT